MLITDESSLSDSSLIGLQNIRISEIMKSIQRLLRLFLSIGLRILKARLQRRFLSQQLNAIFVPPKLQLQNRTCKPLCDFGAILAIYRRGMRYNSRNTVTLSSVFTFQQAHCFCLSNRSVLTFTLTNCTKIAMKSQLVATQFGATKIALSCIELLRH